MPRRPRRRTAAAPALAEDELFAITEGEIVFTAGDETRTVRAGEAVFVPKGTRHCYVNPGPGPARMLTVYTPAGMEGWFREVCAPAEDPTRPPPPASEELLRRMHEAGPRYNVEWLD